jgi:hypothetical protein
VVSTATGALQEPPLNVSTLPAWSTAAQNDADGHETDVSVWPLGLLLGSMLVGAPHDFPSNVWP